MKRSRKNTQEEERRKRLSSSEGYELDAYLLENVNKKRRLQKEEKRVKRQVGVGRRNAHMVS